MGSDSTPWLPDHNAQVNAARVCCVCGRTYTHDELQQDYGWEPTRPGWSCGACTRPRRREVQQAALELIERTKPRWSLILSTPLHEVYDVCFECEALTIAKAILLGRGALTRSESDALRDAVAAGKVAESRCCSGSAGDRLYRL
jgi:hypothetical protein